MRTGSNPDDLLEQSLITVHSTTRAKVQRTPLFTDHGSHNSIEDGGVFGLNDGPSSLLVLNNIDLGVRMGIQN
jgi:hypothetical protein